MPGQNNRKTSSGQSAAELAIFGSIVIFVIGMILKTSLTVNQRANMDLRAFRMALQESYKTALGEYSGSFSAGRNNSYLFVIEDRLTIDPSKKQGTRDRVPTMAQAGATMTMNLFMDVDEDDEEDLPVYDLFINGQRFPLSISRVVTKRPQDLYDSGYIPDCTPNDVGDLRGEFVGVCKRSNGQFYFFTKIYNGHEDWCTDGCSGWSEESRFDLDFDGSVDFDLTAAVPGVGTGAGTLKENFGWQWMRKTESELEEDDLIDIDGDLKEERILDCGGSGAGFHCKVLDNQDGDFDLTWDEGTEEFWDRLGKTVQKPELSNDIRAYAFTKDGTMLRNEEGRLFDGLTGRFVRNETRQDHLDIIERVMYLSNDTQRFCRNGRPRTWGKTNAARRMGVYGMENPVEACGDCFSIGPDGIDRRKVTCMDTAGPVLFIRSRIRDRRRKRWVTLTEEMN